MLRAETLDALPGLVHGFTAGPGPGGGLLDLAPGAPEQDWEWVTAALGRPGMPRAWAQQVHGATVRRVDAPGPAGQADALVTRTPGLLLCVRTADCVPILVVGEGEVAAVHAGWRGVAAGVVGAAVAAMASGSIPAAAVGPCICRDCYEVGPEVVHQIAAVGVPEAVFARSGAGGRPHVDLRAAVAWQLRQAGVDEIEMVGRCTFEDPDLHSYRRDGPTSGRMAALVGLAP